MRQLWAVLRREYIERVRTKGFILSTIAIPVLMVGFIALSAFMGMRAERFDRQWVLVDRTGRIGAEVAEAIGAAGYAADLLDGKATLEDLDARILDDDLEAYIVLDEATLRDGAFSYRSDDSPGSTRTAVLEGIVVREVLRQRIAGLESPGEVQALLDRGGHLDFERVTDDPSGADEISEAEEISGIVTGLAGVFILYISMLIYGAFVLRSVLDEKRNRVVEVVISAVTPGRLMLGKILGVGSMGLTQLGIWAASAALLGLLGVPMLAAALAQEGALGEFAHLLPGAGTLLLLLAYFLLGFFLYAALFAAVGAMCSSEEEAQQAQFPVMMLLIVPFVMQMYSLQGGGFDWMEWAALFPFFTPILMFPRAAAGSVEWWMVAISLLLMALAVVATAWVAGRIYRVGILMQGKRPTLREVVRWVRQA